MPTVTPIPVPIPGLGTHTSSTAVAWSRELHLLQQLALRPPLAPVDGTKGQGCLHHWADSS